jgi:hypothetical protein
MTTPIFWHWWPVGEPEVDDLYLVKRPLARFTLYLTDPTKKGVWG